MSSKLALVTFAAVLALQARYADAQRPGGNARPQFSVVASGENVILLDQRDGRTWLLAHSPGGGTPAWVPIQRIESPEEAQHWREEQHTLAEQRERENREHHEREMRERLEQRRHEMAERREYEQRAQKELERAIQQAQQQELQRKKEAEQRELPAESEEPEALGTRERLKQLGEQTQRAMLESLQQHRKRMIEQFGKEHPAVKSIGEQIERLSRELKKVTGEPDEPKKGDAGPPKPPPQPPEKQSEKEDSSVLESIRKQLDAAKREVDPESIQKQVDAVKRQVDVESIRKQLEAVKRQVDELLSERREGALSDRLRDLQVKEKLLLERLGPDHPEVRAVQIEIEAIRSVNGDSSASDSARSGDEAETSRDVEQQDEANDAKTLSELKSLLMKEQQLLRMHGRQHPAVVEVSKQIEFLRSMQSDDDVERVLAERDEMLKQHEQAKTRARKAALRKRILEEKSDVTLRLEELKQKYGEDSPELGVAEGVLELIQRALDDLEESHNLEHSHRHGHGRGHEDSHNHSGSHEEEADGHKDSHPHGDAHKQQDSHE